MCFAGVNFENLFITQITHAMSTISFIHNMYLTCLLLVVDLYVKIRKCLTS